MLNRKDYRKYHVKNKPEPCCGCALLYTDKRGIKKCIVDVDNNHFDCWEFLENGEERNYIFKLIKKEGK